MQSELEKLSFGPRALWTLAVLVALLFGLVVAAEVRGAVGAFGVGGLIFLAPALVGAVLGFIFAVPRVVARDQGQTVTEDTKSRILSTNTNLERISDWLTTMLVGVGLSQLTNLNGVFLQFRYFLAETATVYDVDGRASAGVLPAIGPFILIFGAASGFLFMYLVTRLVLVRFFRDSETLLSGLAVAAIRVAVKETQSASCDGTAAPAPNASASAPDSPSAPSPARASPPATLPADARTVARLLAAAQTPTLSSDEALAIMYELLYQAGGYRGVIQMEGPLSSTAIAKKPEYWFYLAAAFGQQMHHSAPGSDDFQSARDNALDAARRAVRLDKSFRTRLWHISNPSSVDNDLALLRDDSEFLALVGRA